MHRIREMLVQGYNYNSIIADIGVSERTFFRYLKRVFAADIKNLERATEEQMMRAVSIHIERANYIYQKLDAIASDTNINAEYRLNALNDMFKLSRGLIETYGNAPAAAIYVKRKLAAMEKGIPESVYNSHMSRFLPPAKFGYDNPPPAEQQEQQEQERVEPVRAGGPEEEREDNGHPDYHS